MDDYIKLGEAARLLGVSSATLHNWQDLGLLIPDVCLPSGHRRYSMSQLKKFSSDNNIILGDKEMFITSFEASSLLGLTVYELNRLEKEGILVPRERLPVSNKRLYALSDIVAYKESKPED